MIILSKSKFTTGLACPKLLWCMFNAKEKIPPHSEATQALFEQGHEVGNLAKQYFPKGIEVDWDKGFKHTLEETQKLVKQGKTIYEASFTYKHAYCRVDILLPKKKHWDIIEVKSTSQVKEEHIPDVAFQKYCLESAGIHVGRCHLMHLNNEYVKKGKINPKKIFVIEDITEQVNAVLPIIEGKLNELVKIVQNPKMPSPMLGTECLEPKKCLVCMPDLPEHNVTELNRAGKKAYSLLNQGIKLIKDLPPDFKLSQNQKIQQQAIKSGKPYILSQPIKDFLKNLAYPLYFLDFETVNPAIPLFDGMRPFQRIPFQLSLHIVKKPGGKLAHVEFLADNPKDPRSGIVKALKSIGPKGTILAYNMGFEKGIIEELNNAFPKEKWLHKLIDRFDDLCIPFRSFWYYHPKQHGRYSIKAVLPALTNKSYKGMEISSGEEAQRKFLKMMYKGEKGDMQQLRKALLAYCGQDTEGMVRILEVLS